MVPPWRLLIIPDTIIHMYASRQAKITPACIGTQIQQVHIISYRDFFFHLASFRRCFPSFIDILEVHTTRRQETQYYGLHVGLTRVLGAGCIKQTDIEWCTAEKECIFDKLFKSDCLPVTSSSGDAQTAEEYK